MTTHGVRLAGTIALLYAARRYFRNWGTTKDECRMPLAGDELVDAPVAQTTEAVWIDAPAGAVWPWLVQMGQDRGGLYSYATLENLVGLRYQNADCIHPEWQHLEPGDVIRLAPKGWLGLRDGIALDVVAVADQESIVLRGTPPGQPAAGVWSIHVVPHFDDGCRLLIRTRIEVRGPGQHLVCELADPARALMTRGILLGIKRRAEQQVQGERSAAKASEHLHRVVW